MGILRRRTWEDIEPKLRGSFSMLCIDTVWIWCPHCSIKYCFIKNYSLVVSSHEYLFRARVYSQSDKSCWKLVTHASGHFLPTHQYNPIYIYVYIYSIITMPFGDIEKKNKKNTLSIKLQSIDFSVGISYQRSFAIEAMSTKRKVLFESIIFHRVRT